MGEQATEVRSRIDPAVKHEAAEILGEMGLTMSEGIRLFLNQVVAERALPFAINKPNAVTLAAIRDTEAGVGLRASSLKDLAKLWDEA